MSWVHITAAILPSRVPRICFKVILVIIQAYIHIVYVCMASPIKGPSLIFQERPKTAGAGQEPEGAVEEAEAKEARLFKGGFKFQIQFRYCLV